MENNSFKVAIVTDDGNSVSQHFGSAPFYEVFTIENGSIIHHERRDKYNPHGPGMKHQHQHHNDLQNSDNKVEFLHHSHGNHNGGMHGHHEHSNDKHSQMISNIADCRFLIARGMGYGTFVHLEAANIKPIITDIKLMEDAVKAVIEGTIVNHTEKLH